MDDTVISVKNVSKAYRLWNDPAARFKAPMWDVLGHCLPGRPAARCFEKAAGYFRDFYALKDVSFDVKKGESVGIIGRNGSGKSTLLQIIAGTLQPTGGTVEVRGRVAALLELGSGFNPEFTGRENVYMNAAILGLTREETDARFDAIASFADIGQFLDQPVKTYSSGMVVRLAFAVQVVIEPDILIVDEALSVGDEAFQRKCYDRMERLKTRGTTLIFVSHSAGLVVQLCDRAMLLHQGAKFIEGQPKNVVTIYHKWLYSAGGVAAELQRDFNVLENATEGVDSGTDQTGGNGMNEFLAPGLAPHTVVEYSAQGAKIIDPHIETLSGIRLNNLARGAEYVYAYSVAFTRTMSGVRCGCLFKTTHGIELGGIVSHSPRDCGLSVRAAQVLEVRFRFACRMLPGVYFLNAGVVARTERGEEFMHRLVDAAIFRVLDEPDLPVTGTVDFMVDRSCRVLQ